MRTLSAIKRAFYPLLAVLLQACATAPAPGRAGAAQPTTVFLVRHAEKDPTPGLADPPLTPAGQQRALALRDLLARYPLTAIYSTSTLRTTATAQPTAQTRGLAVQPYDPRQLPALASRLRRQYRGRAVLVVGHSNTILETVEAFGAARPVPTIADADYHYLLEVTLPADSTQAATAVARHYGTGAR